MSQGGGGGGLAQDRPVGDKDAADYTVEELLWVMSNPGKTPSQNLKEASGRRQGGTINATSAEGIERLRKQRQTEQQLSNAAAGEQKKLTSQAQQAVGGTTAPTTAAPASNTRTAPTPQAIEEEMYTSYLGL